MSDEAIRVMVVDDHPMWRDAVERDPEDAGFEVVAVAANGNEALAVFPRPVRRWWCSTSRSPARTGSRSRPRWRAGPSARVLILSASGEQADVLEAVKAGATGYLVKSASRSELIAAAVRRGPRATPCSPPDSQARAGRVPPDARGLDRHLRPGDGDLTDRETEILKMVAKGMYKQIAERLVISHRTVQNHVQNTLRKLQMHNRVELTRYAIAQGLDDDADADLLGVADELYGLTLPEFTPTRDARQGAKASDAPLATRVRAAQAVHGGLVNLLVRQESEQVAQVPGGRRLREAQAASRARSRARSPGSVDSSRPQSRTARAPWPRTGRR